MTQLAAPFPVIGFAAYSGTGKPLLHPGDNSIIAVASDQPLEIDLPCLDINQPEAIAVFILDRITPNRTGTHT